MGLPGLTSAKNGLMCMLNKNSSDVTAMILYVPANDFLNCVWMGLPELTSPKNGLMCLLI